MDGSRTVMVVKLLRLLVKTLKPNDGDGEGSGWETCWNTTWN
jgi:hypothetical protein